jgi:hypothetical protein
MKVIFQRAWIDPEGRRHRHQPNVAQEIENAFVKDLPRDAVIVEGAPEEAPVTTADVREQLTLSSQDVERQDLDAEVKRLEALEANQSATRRRSK